MSRNLPERKNPAYRIDASDIFAVIKTKQALETLLKLQYRPQKQQLIILCIGTDRSTGDALGPLVGTRLKGLRPVNTDIFGTLEEPVHAVNLSETIEKITETYSSPFIIAVDACLGRQESVGCIDIGLGPTRPGAGVNKDLPPVGQIHIDGIVNVGGFLEHFVLQNTRLSLVMRLAEIITRGLFLTLQNLHSSSTQSEAIRM
ncbi:MAG: spore protease YyaC [Firmicutes bacterium]|nr:spore protease YyaC [Bacillota bacterium]